MKYFSTFGKHLSVFVAALLVLTGCASGPGTAQPPSEHLTAGIFLDNPWLHHQLQALAPPPALVPEGLELTEASEGWREARYDDVAGFCTIGFGHLIKKSHCDGSGPENPDFLQPISRETGAQILSRDMWTAQHAVAAMVKQELNGYQFAAITDFVFNVGSNNFQGSHLLVVLNEGKFEEVGDQLKRWTMAGGRQVKGLQDRRFREADLFYRGQKHQVRAVAPLPPIDIRIGEEAAH